MNKLTITTILTVSTNFYPKKLDNHQKQRDESSAITKYKVPNQHYGYQTYDLLKFKLKTRASNCGPFLLIHLNSLFKSCAFGVSK